ncbi:MAG: hypothetical protein U0271_34380 [Polyangiaceae bacterium]
MLSLVERTVRHTLVVSFLAMGSGCASSPKSSVEYDGISYTQPSELVARCAEFLPSRGFGPDTGERLDHARACMVRAEEFGVGVEFAHAFERYIDMLRAFVDADAAHARGEMPAMCKHLARAIEHGKKSHELLAAADAPDPRVKVELLSEVEAQLHAIILTHEKVGCLRQ